MKGFIFDMDGVVVDNHRYHFQTWMEFASKYKFELNASIYREKFNGKTNPDLFKMIFGDISLTQMNAYAEEKESNYQKLYANDMKAHTGLISFLDYLKTHQYKIALGTSAPTSNVDFTLDRLFLRKYFDVIVDGSFEGMSARTFAEKFSAAVKIAEIDTSRAVTHNKGIMNGIDAVVLATGNDFRAIEACAHAYAARDGQYRSLSKVTLSEDTFKFSLTVPLAVGTVGGLTSLHPLAKTSLAILEKPSAKELMQVMASVGLAQNFGAIKSLVTTGIQKGHMKLHLLNVFNQLGASHEEIEKGKEYFSDKVVSFTAVRNFLESIKQLQ